MLHISNKEDMCCNNSILYLQDSCSVNVFVHIKIIDVYQTYKYNYVLIADVLHCMLLLYQRFRCSDQPIKEGSWGCPHGVPPPGGCLTSARGGRAAYRGAARRGRPRLHELSSLGQINSCIQGAARRGRPRLATRNWARWRCSAQ
jgi:hypothetical protein